MPKSSGLSAQITPERVLKSSGIRTGVETVQKLLLLGSALEQEHVAKRVAQLAERRHREVILALYRDRLDYPSARSKLGVGVTELKELHQAALAALVDSLNPLLSPNH